MREHVGEVDGFGVDAECHKGPYRDDDTVWIYPCRFDALDGKVYVDVTFGLSTKQADALAGLLLAAVRRNEQMAAAQNSTGETE